MDDNLKCQLTFNHKICFSLRIIQRIMHLEIVHSLYYAYFHSALIYDIIFLSNSPPITRFLARQALAS